MCLYVYVYLKIFILSQTGTFVTQSENELLDMLITLMTSLYIVYMYQTTTLYT